MAIVIFRGEFYYIAIPLIRKGKDGYIVNVAGRKMAMARVKNGSRTPAIVKLKNFDSSNVNKMGVADI